MMTIIGFLFMMYRNVYKFWDYKVTAVGLTNVLSVPKYTVVKLTSI